MYYISPLNAKQGVQNPEIRSPNRGHQPSLPLWPESTQARQRALLPSLRLSLWPI